MNEVATSLLLIAKDIQDSINQTVLPPSDGSPSLSELVLSFFLWSKKHEDISKKLYIKLMGHIALAGMMHVQ